MDYLHPGLSQIINLNFKKNLTHLCMTLLLFGVCLSESNSTVFCDKHKWKVTVRLPSCNHHSCRWACKNHADVLKYQDFRQISIMPGGKSSFLFQALVCIQINIIEYSFSFCDPSLICPGLAAVNGNVVVKQAWPRTSVHICGPVIC